MTGSTGAYGGLFSLLGTGQSNPTNNTSSAAYIRNNTANSAYIISGSGGAPNAISLNTTVCVFVVNGGSGSQTYFNNSLVSTDSGVGTSVAAISTILLGGGASGIGQWDGPISLFGFWSGAWTSGNRTTAYSYLSTKYGC